MSDYEDRYVPALAIVRVTASLALELKVEMMRCVDCVNSHNSGRDWRDATPGDYAELCPERMSLPRGDLPKCKHWIPTCSDAIRLRKLSLSSAEVPISVNVLSEVRERVLSHLLKQGAWRDSSGPPHPGKDAIVGFAFQVLEILRNKDGADKLLSLYEEIGGAFDTNGVR